jgi:hypothetical protein
MQQVAKLGLEAAAMVHDEAVAAFALGDKGASLRPGKGIGHAVAHAEDAPVGWSDDVHARPGRGSGKDTDVDAIMGVVGGTPAREIPDPVARVQIDVVLDEAGAAGLAADGQCQTNGLGGRGGDHLGREAGEHGGRQCSAPRIMANSCHFLAHCTVAS